MVVRRSSLLKSLVLTRFSGFTLFPPRLPDAGPLDEMTTLAVVGISETTLTECYGASRV